MRAERLTTGTRRARWAPGPPSRPNTSTLIIYIYLIFITFSPTHAQEDLVLDEAYAPAAPPTVAPATLAPIVGDFSADKKAFESNVRTPAEDAFLEEIEAGRRRIEGGQPLYRRYPGLAIVAEAAAGLFGAGVVGLVGGSIGEAIDPGNEDQPLGGASGQAFGLLGGAYVGSSMGVWGASRLFEKPVHPGWAFLGSGVGTVVGGGAATGLLFALEDEPTTAGGLAVATLFLFQVGGAMLFTEVGLPE